MGIRNELQISMRHIYSARLLQTRCVYVDFGLSTHRQKPVVVLVAVKEEVSSFERERERARYAA